MRMFESNWRKKISSEILENEIFSHKGTTKAKCRVSTAKYWLKYLIKYWKFIFELYPLLEQQKLLAFTWIERPSPNAKQYHCAVLILWEKFYSWNLIKNFKW